MLHGKRGPRRQQAVGRRTIREQPPRKLAAPTRTLKRYLRAERMDAQQHVWFSVSMRAIAAMAFRPNSVGDPRHRRDVLYAQVNNAVYHFYIDDAVNLHLARSGVSNDVRRFTSENSMPVLACSSRGRRPSK